MMAAGKMQRLSLLCGLLLAALAVCGLQRSFLAIDARSNPRSQTPVMQQGQQGLPQMPRAASTEWTSWAATGVLAAGAAALALKSQHRDESSATMFSKHDKRTFRGKLHAHTFGKYRLRKNKARRIQAIKNGTFDPEKVVQRGQPEPEHPWDLDNIVENPMIYYAPDYFKEVLYDYWDDVNAKMREKWQDYMGIKGNQRYFKNWTPPGMEPPPPEPEPTPPPPAPKKPKSDPPEEKPKAAPKAEEKKPEPKPEPKEEEAPPPKAEEKKPEPKPEPKEEKAPPPKAEEKKPEPKPEPKEEKAPPPKAEEKKPEPKPEPKEEKAPPPKAEEKKPEPKPEPKEEKAPPPKAEEKKPEPKPEPKEDKAPPPKAEEKKPEAKSGAAPSAKDVKTLRERSKAGILDCKKALSETDGDMEKAMEWLKKKGMAKADKKAGNVTVEGCVASYVHFNNKIAVLVEVNSETDFVAQNAIFKEFAGDVAMQVAANDDVTVMTVDDVPEDVREKVKKQEMEKEDLAGKPDAIKEKIVAGRLNKKFEEKALMNQKWLKDDNITVQEAVKQIIAKLGENIVVRRFERLTLGEGLEKKDQDFAAGVEKELAKYKTEGEAKEEPKEEPKAEKKEEKEEKKEEKKAVQVSAAQVKELRGRSGAGILDAKKALAECDCDMDKAMEWLKKKGMAKADKKAGNLSVEGVIASYVHFNSKLGVLVEVNSETDFVALNDIFKEFAADVAMQVAAQPDVKFVSVDEVPADVKEKEKALEMGKEDLAGKPDNIKEKIVEGRLKKKFEETALLGQKWLKDEDKTVQEVLKEKIAKLGENIVIRRFQRLTLGEGLDKKDDDFAAGVEKELAKYRQ